MEKTLFLQMKDITLEHSKHQFEHILRFQVTVLGWGGSKSTRSRRLSDAIDFRSGYVLESELCTLRFAAWSFWMMSSCQPGAACTSDVLRYEMLRTCLDTTACSMALIGTAIFAFDFGAVHGCFQSAALEVLNAKAHIDGLEGCCLVEAASQIDACAWPDSRPAHSVFLHPHTSRLSDGLPSSTPSRRSSRIVLALPGLEAREAGRPPLGAGSIQNEVYTEVLPAKWCRTRQDQLRPWQPYPLEQEMISCHF